MKIGRINNIIPYEVKNQTTGEIYTLCRSLTDGAGLLGLSVTVEDISPGHRSSLSHYHSIKDEIYLLLNGEVSVHVGGNVTVLKRGEFVIFEHGVREFHYLSNRSDEDATILIISSSSEMDIVYYEG